jgi:hypothetical protein
MTDLEALAARVTALESGKEDVPAAAVPPMFTMANDKVLSPGGALSTDPSDYDYDMLDITDKGTGSSAKKGTYVAGAMRGFAGLGSLATGDSGASTFGGWFKYNHFGAIMAKSGTGPQVFSVGMPTGENPVPEGSKTMNVSWSGTMAGVRMMTGEPAIPAANELVSGDAKIMVDFEATGTGYASDAELTITGVKNSSGTALGTFTSGDTGETNAAWMDMDIMDGAFVRDDDTTTGEPPGEGDDLQYLAGRFYGPDGMEVGGVFKELGQLTLGNADNTGANAANIMGSFGASRDSVVP